MISNNKHAHVHKTLNITGVLIHEENQIHPKVLQSVPTIHALKMLICLNHKDYHYFSSYLDIKVLPQIKAFSSLSFCTVIRGKIRKHNFSGEDFSKT